MNLHLLRLFSAVVENEGVVAAARSLRLSQPAVSRAVRELETQMGIPLLERTTRRVRLTPEGREIYQQARAIYLAERAVEDTAARLKGLRQGTLHVGASTTIATYVLPPIISAFAKRHPDIELRLSAVHTRVIVERLKEHELDVALAEAPVDDRDITVSAWRIDHMVVIAAPSHRFANRVVAPTSLADELFILREPESGTRAIVIEALTRSGVEPRRVMSVDDTEVIKQVAAEGLGIGIVSRYAVADQLASKRLVTLHVDGLSIERPFNRLSLGKRSPSTAAEAFLALLERSDRRTRRAPEGSRR
jgi:DNA-binding transcriptional LysR family regulator